MDTLAGLATQRTIALLSKGRRAVRRVEEVFLGIRRARVRRLGEVFLGVKVDVLFVAVRNIGKMSALTGELTRTRGLVAGGIAAIQLQAGMGTEVDVVEELVVVEVVGQQ